MADLCSECMKKEIQETDQFRQMSWKLHYTKFVEGDGTPIRRVISTEENVLCYHDLLHEALGIAKFAGLEYSNDGVHLDYGITDYWTGLGCEMFIRRSDK